MLQGSHDYGGPHTGNPGTLLASQLQTALLLPSWLAALHIACAATVSAAPVFLEGVKAFLRVTRCAGNTPDQGALIFRRFPTTESLYWTKAVHLLCDLTPFGLKGQEIMEEWWRGCASCKCWYRPACCTSLPYLHHTVQLRTCTYNRGTVAGVGLQFAAFFPSLVVWEIWFLMFFLHQSK